MDDAGFTNRRGVALRGGIAYLLHAAVWFVWAYVSLSASVFIAAFFGFVVFQADMLLRFVHVPGWLAEAMELTVLVGCMLAAGYAGGRLARALPFPPRWAEIPVVIALGTLIGLSYSVYGTAFEHHAPMGFSFGTQASIQVAHWFVVGLGFLVGRRLALDCGADRTSASSR